MKHLHSTALVQSLLRVGLIQFDLWTRLASQFDIFLDFSVKIKNKEAKRDVRVWEVKRVNSNSLSPASYLARWSTASTTLVPSLALVSQNKAPYACEQSINIPEWSRFIYTPGRARRLCKLFFLFITRNKSFSPWPTSLREGCSHTSPQRAALGGPPCFQ